MNDKTLHIALLSGALMSGALLIGAVGACQTLLGDDFVIVEGGSGGDLTGGGGGTTSSGMAGSGGESDCPTGTADCNGDAADGCEVALDSDAAHCGACGRACAMDNVQNAICAAGLCTSTCGSGFGNCVQPAEPDADDGCEVTLGVSSNCSACGHDCGGGACESGDCRAFSLNGDFGSVNDMALDESNVYWCNRANGTIELVPHGGGGVTALHTAAATVHDIAIDGTHLYWATDSTGDTVGRVEKAGGVPEVLHPMNAKAIGVNDTTLFYVLDDNTLMMSSKDGTSPAALATGLSVPRDLAVNGNHVFISDTGFQGIMHVEAPGGALTQFYMLVANDIPNRITLDATHVYWSGGSNGKLWRGSQQEGSALTEIVSLPAGDTRGLGVTATHVYFCDAFNEEIRRVPLAGGAHELVEPNQPDCDALVVNESAVFWGGRTNGNIQKKVLAP